MQELLVGDRAPALKAFDLRTNEPLGAFEPGRIYVVEFWATWCGPCRRSIPHMAAMHDKFDKAKIIGVAVREESRAVVESFVSEQGSAIPYQIAVDSDIELPGNNEGWSYVNWCKAAFRAGIPASFIVDRSGRIAWMGHPMSLDQPLSAIEAGSWDIEAAAAAHRASLDANHVREIFKLHAANAAWIAGGDASTTLATFDEVFSERPQVEIKMGAEKLTILLAHDRKRAIDYGRYLCEKIGPGDEDLLFKVSSVLLEGAQAATKRGEPIDEAVLALAEEALSLAASSLKDPNSPSDRMMIERQMARLKLFANRREAAAQHVRDATALAHQAKSSPHVIDDLKALEAMCAEV